MKTAVRRVLLLSALMSPGALYALGLGEIRLNSALNQPFDAEIDLVSATQEDLGALRAALASNDTFARYGLDRPAYLSDFSFRVTKGPGGRDVLRVTSPRPVTEPFVTDAQVSRRQSNGSSPFIRSSSARARRGTRISRPR